MGTRDQTENNLEISAILEDKVNRETDTGRG